MKIKLNDIFSTEVNPDYSNWEELTKGKHTTALNLYKRMPYFTEVSGRTMERFSFSRCDGTPKNGTVD